MADLLQPVVRALGYAVLEIRDEGTSVLVSKPPAWFDEIWGSSQAGDATIAFFERSPFLAAFLEEAEAQWSSSKPSECHSGAWIERSATGTEIPLQATALRFDARKFLVIRNLGAQYRQQLENLQTARSAALVHEQLLREIQKKEILLHCIVHDLSQPLSAMRAAFDCVSGEKVSGRAKKFADLGKLASQEQESMIRAILQTFSADLRTAMEGATGANTATDLLAAAQAAMTTLLPAYEVKRVGLALEAKIDKQASWRVVGEETRLRRVFANLLENALRYSAVGGAVTIGLEQKNGACTAFVDDEGKGLPEDLGPEQIFGLLSKGKQGGGKAGLGLYFCKITVERWGGAIGCESRLPRGSRFWFRLPQARDSAMAARPAREQESSAEGPTSRSRKAPSFNILLADDQEDIRALTSHQLTRAGHRVVAVADGREAISAAQQLRFDVVLLDEQMPVMSGVEAARAFRKQASASNPVPLLVALTGNTAAEDRARLRAAGFDVVLGKPFRLEALAEILSGLPAGATEAALLDGADDGEESPIEVLSRRVNGDKNLVRKLIASFLRDLPSRMNSMKRALIGGDAAKVGALAHALKGSVSIFGASQARARSEELQNLGRSGDLQPARTVFEFLKDDVAKLGQKLRRYTRPRKIARRAKASGRRRSRGRQRKRK